MGAPGRLAALEILKDVGGSAPREKPTRAASPQGAS